jgi:hypothetical protein
MMAIDHQQLPTTAVQLAGHGINTVVGGLTPPMLGILLLVCAGLGASTYFLNILITGQQMHLQQVLAVQQAEVHQILETHDREFDALMKMVRDTMDAATAAMKPAPAPPPAAITPEIPPEIPPEAPPKKGR